jgi:hypothetical protein
MFCRNCGFELKDSDKKCPGCGSPVVPLKKGDLPGERVATWVQTESEPQVQAEEPKTEPKPMYVYDDGKEYKGQGYDKVEIPKDDYKYESKAAAPRRPTSSDSSISSPGSASYDSGSLGWGLLGCCIPIVGLILFLVWKDERPKSAKVAGIGALISVIITVVFVVFSIVLGIGSSMYYYGVKIPFLEDMGINV